MIGDDYHAHLDKCEQCREHPFEQCSVGHELLMKVGREVKTATLIKPDLERCQAEKPNGVNFMTLGGRPGMIRCADKPVLIATEKEVGKDGQRGQMSLCTHCHLVFLKQMPEGHATFEEIKR